MAWEPEPCARSCQRSMGLAGLVVLSSGWDQQATAAGCTSSAATRRDPARADVRTAAQPAPHLWGDTAAAHVGLWSPPCQWAQNWHRDGGTCTHLCCCW